MKNSMLFLVGALSLFLFSLSGSVHAAARSNEGFDYLLRNPSLGKFTAGAYIGTAERKVTTFGSSFESTLSADRLYGYLGYDLTRWLNLYAVFGSNDATLSGTSDGGTASIFGGGLSMNLLNRYIREPTPALEDAFRINADLRYLSTQTDVFMSTINWQEFTASLRFSLLNFPTGQKSYRPEAIALYAGPSFSQIISKEIDSKRDFGFVGGIEIFIVDSLSIDVSVANHGPTSLQAGVNIRF
jgi:opacity protein-like surface antigen